MQFKVPQDVQREDHIVGPLTLKQLIICGVGGGIAYALYVSLAKNYIWITWLPPVTIVTLLTVAFAFLRPLDLSFSKWILRNLELLLIPRKRYWIQGSAEVLPPSFPKIKPQGKTEKKAQQKADQILDKHKKLEELTKILNSTPHTT